jgi:hypothetical protein
MSKYKFKNISEERTAIIQLPDFTQVTMNFVINTRKIGNNKSTLLNITYQLCEPGRPIENIPVVSNRISSITNQGVVEVLIRKWVKTNKIEEMFYPSLSKAAILLINGNTSFSMKVKPDGTFSYVK